MYSRAYVEITNICNMSCSFCHGHSRPRRQMTREEFARVLQQVEGKTQYLYYHLMGEPLTHPLLPLFLQMASDRGFRSILTTNGSLLGKRGEELLSSPLYKVSISLHSFEEGSEADFGRYLEEVASFADRAAAGGILVVLRLWNRGFAEQRNQKILQFLRERLTGDWTENTRGIRIREKLHLEWGDRFEWPDMEASFRSEEVFCYGMLEQFGILADGSVVPCCLDSEGVITLGNVFEEELTSILHTPRAQAMAAGFRRHRASEELCHRCGYAQRFQ